MNAVGTKDCQSPGIKVSNIQYASRTQILRREDLRVLRVFVVESLLHVRPIRNHRPAEKPASPKRDTGYN